MPKLLLAFLTAALATLAAATAVLADDPHRGNSGNFSTATCPSANNPHCPPQGGG